MPAKDRSQMGIFMDYLPNFVVNYEHMNLLTVYNNQLCSPNRFWLQWCPLDGVCGKRELSIR